jgi:hypothetical protein
MRIDQRNTGNGIGGLTGSYLTYNIQPSSFYTIDRFSIVSPNVGALTAKQVILNDSDKVAVGGGFTNAVEIGLVPKDGLSFYSPFEGNANDIINNSTPTITGTPQYVTASVIGSNAMYLANTAGTTASHYIRYTSYVFTPSFTVSLWTNFTSFLTGGGQNAMILTTTGSSALTNALWIGQYVGYIRCGFFFGNDVGSIALSSNRWYHISVTHLNGTLTLYVNGVSNGTATGTLAQNGFMLGNGYTTDTRAFAGIIDDLRIYNRVLSATEIAALATSVGIPATPATTVISGLTTCLTFDNTTADAQGTLSAPTVTGTAVYTPVCKVGTSALDLTANIVAATSTFNTGLLYTSVSLSYPITVSLWFNASQATGNYQVPISIGTSSAALFQIAIQNSNGYLYYEGVTTLYLTSSAIIPGTWYHICLTIQSNSYVCGYINGILTVSAITSSISLSTIDRIRIGNAVYSTSFPFKGLIDDVRIYNRVLSSAEVAGLYASSQYASYSLFQQTIEGNNMSDLGWGTSNAQPISASMWIKNNSSNSQQFSIAANNTSMLAWIDFEGGSYADKLNFLTNATLVGSGTFTNTTYKIGTTAFNLTANTVYTTPITFIDYNVPMTLQIPLMVSQWINASTVVGSGFIVVTSLSAAPFSTVSNTEFNIELVINPSGNVYIEASVNGTLYQTPITTVISASNWYHICYGIANGTLLLYINGNLLASSTVPINGVLTNYYSTNAQISQFRIGGQTGTGIYAFKGYIDDVRIYNCALSAEQVRQLYTNNANSTTSSTYLIPRSVVYNTPSIPANSWQKVSVIIPGDTSGNWMTNTDAGLTLSLCLGSSALYNTTNVASTSGNAVTVWNNTPEYMGNSVQLYGSSSNNLLSSVNNSVYVTGWQLERGSIMTTFDIRPLGIELQLCQRYYQKFISYWLGLTFNTNFLYNGILSLKTTMRAFPNLDDGATFLTSGGSLGTVALYVQAAGRSTTDSVVIWNTANNWTANTQANVSLGLTAEL